MSEITRIGQISLPYTAPIVVPALTAGPPPPASGESSEGGSLGGPVTLHQPSRPASWYASRRPTSGVSRGQPRYRGSGRRYMGPGLPSCATQRQRAVGGTCQLPVRPRRGPYGMVQQPPDPSDSRARGVADLPGDVRYAGHAIWLWDTMQSRAPGNRTATPRRFAHPRLPPTSNDALCRGNLVTF